MASQGGGQKVDKGHGSYFYAESARDSFCGCLDPDFEVVNGFSEGDIADFIRVARPDLFNQLKQLPIASIDIIRAEQVPQHQDCRSSANHQLSNRRSLILTPLRILISPAQDRDHNSTIRAVADHGERMLLDLEHKRQIQQSLLNGFDLTLQKTTTRSTLLRCAVPACARKGTKIADGDFFLSLWKELRDGSGRSVKRSEAHYGLACLEALFDRGLSLGTPHELDGQLDGSAAAPEFPYKFPSNSPEAVYLRAKRYSEIPNTLLDDQARVDDIIDAVSAGDDKTPDLSLCRPSNLSPYETRYKKQGRTHEKKAKSYSLPPTSEEPPRAQKSMLHTDVPICFCRELPNGSELVQCDSESCMIGTFHLDCLGLDEPLKEGDLLYCMYCAEDLYGFEQTTLDQTVHLPASVVSYDLGAVDDSTDLVLESTEREMGESRQASDPGRFKAINRLDGAYPHSPATPVLQPVSRASRTKPAQANLLIPLPPGASQATFVDLAPFLTAANQKHSPTGLSEQEMCLFREWQTSCPGSRLLQALPVAKRVKRRLGTMKAGPVSTRASLNRRLSEVLQGPTLA